MSDYLNAMPPMPPAIESGQDGTLGPPMGLTESMATWARWMAGWAWERRAMISAMVRHISRLLAEIHFLRTLPSYNAWRISFVSRRISLVWLSLQVMMTRISVRRSVQHVVHSTAARHAGWEWDPRGVCSGGVRVE